MKSTLYLLLCSLFLVACNTTETTTDEFDNISWEEISQQSAGKTVNFMMWQGSPVVNDYINNYLIPEVKKRFNIDLKISGGQGPEIVQLVMNEKEAGVADGQVDIAWINGETFFQLRQVDGLWGPFVKKLPNAEFINFDDPIISRDFQQDVNYMECPWSVTQFSMVYDTVKVPDPPRSLPELATYVKANPGKFTISNDFTGMSLLKNFMAELGGGKNALDGAFDEGKYTKLSAELWKFINENKPYFWKKGDTFPNEHSKMDQLFASGELDIVYGFSEGGIEEKVRSGLFTKSTRGYAWKNGMLKNANYVGVLHNSPNKAAAMVVLNFMLSPEAQLKKTDIEGMNANTVLNVDKLPAEWQDKFKSAPKRQYGPMISEFADFTISEPAPEYMIRLFEDFRTQIIEK